MSTIITTTPDLLQLVLLKDEPRIDSRLLAQQLRRPHYGMFELIKRYEGKLKKLGKVTFQMGASEGSKTGQKERFALLNENQAYFVLALSRNTATVVDSKLKLILSFDAARRANAMRQTGYLPTYHALHDRIHALAAGSPNERFIHMNVNRLVNKAVGLKAGQRPSAPLPQQALLVVAQHVATQALQQADSHHDGYEVAKNAVLNLSRALLLGGSAA